MSVRTRKYRRPCKTLVSWPVVLAALMAGAVAVPGVGIAQTAAEEELVWPLPPDSPRIRYAGALRSERDLGKGRSFLGRIAGSLLGSEDNVVSVKRPHDVYVDPEGRIFVTNGLEAGFWFFDPSEKKAELIIPEGLAALGKPMGLDGDDEGSLFIADSRAGRVLELDRDGEFINAFGGQTVLLNPVDVAVSPAGDRVYVADSYLHQIVIFDRSGDLLGRIGLNVGDLAAKRAKRSKAAAPAAGEGVHAGREPSDLIENRGIEPGQFRYPAFVAVAPDGTVYVSDGLNFRVQAFDRDGNFLRVFGGLGDTPGSFARPKGVAVDSEGHVYVADAAFNNVQVFNAEGELLLGFARFGRGPGDLWLPIGVSIDADDRIFVVDRYNDRVQVYQYLAAPDGEDVEEHGSPSSR